MCFENGQGQCFRCGTQENKDLWFGRPVDLERHAISLKVGEKVQVEKQGKKVVIYNINGFYIYCNSAFSSDKIASELS